MPTTPTSSWLTAAAAAVVALSLTACGPSSSTPRGDSVASKGTGAVGSTGGPALGAASGFAILATTAVTCTDATILGNVGVSPGTSITQTSCPVTGTVNPGDTTAAQAQVDFLLAYDSLAALACDQVLTTLDGQTLAPGVYCFDAAVTSTGGVLTLAGPAGGSWIFKVGTLGTGALTGTGFSVLTAAGTPPPCGAVTWWVAEAATLTDSQFVGTVLAGGAITVTRGTFSGNAYSKAAVTVTGDAFTGCAATSGPPACGGQGGSDDESASGGDHGSNGSSCGGQGDGEGDHGGDHDGGHRGPHHD